MKKLSLVVLLMCISIGLSGCLKKDSMENITIYTTAYPIEYITNNLYGNHGTINSIYPSNVNILNYKLTDKQLTDYSAGNLFIYNGLSHEGDYAVSMINKNPFLKIIDSSISMEYVNDIEELWINPSNLLMLAQNIRNGFKEYITNPYLKNEIDEKYEALKIKISEIDAELRLITENATNKTIVVSDDLFLFLEKYGLNVISLEDNDNLTDKKISDVKKLINNKTIAYIFTKPNENVNKMVKNFVNNYGAELLTIHTLSNLTEQERTEKMDFIQIMNNNIDLLKKELYQ